MAGARRNNLDGVTVGLPLGVMSVITGVSGSGKSSLAAELVEQHPEVVVIDQRAVSTNRRSTPITYTGIAPAIRKLFSKRNGVPASRFSANSDGACPECRGLGVVHTDLAFMDGQELTCERCQGRRFMPEVLAHTVDGLSIADVDELTVQDALHRLDDRSITRSLAHLAEVGLGYLTLGQPLPSLSGGECQRLKIAKELQVTDEPTTYLLDEPTTGLHLGDVDNLLGVLDRLVDRGHTVVVIEHHLEVIVRADWLVDLGPGAGRHGGRVLYEGPVAGYGEPSTPTGRALADHAGSVAAVG